MSAEMSRRMFLRVAAANGVGLAMTNCSAIPAADSTRKSQVHHGPVLRRDRSQGHPREAIELAQRFGFEAVEPAPDFLGKLSDDALAELLAEMKAKKLVWAAAGLPVEFRNTDAAFQDSLKRLPDFARTLQRAGVTRVGTWLSPSHGSLTYMANFRRHAQRLREVAKVLADHGLRLGLEYVGPKTSWSAGRFPVHPHDGRNEGPDRRDRLPERRFHARQLALVHGPRDASRSALPPQRRRRLLPPQRRPAGDSGGPADRQPPRPSRGDRRDRPEGVSRRAGQRSATTVRSWPSRSVRTSVPCPATKPWPSSLRR